MTSEKSILNQCLVALSKVPGVRCWRNNTGQAWTGRKIVRLEPGAVIRAGQRDVLIRDGRPIQFGLPGSGDIIGLRQVTITQDMVGQRIGQFMAVETKSEKGRQSDQQQRFEAMVNGLGGTYVLARSPEEAREKIRGGSDDER